ncbi:MAG: S8 family serine peptidase [Candidatus Cloacimonetes bacterium]|nr:S8 family serine peptidase [Candidatus Cloacimonadota bacterium]MDY0366159.1 S8 family serine peptidase [Candidatus Syntrophosphaera sp.]
MSSKHIFPLLALLLITTLLPALNLTPGQLIVKTSQPLDPKSNRTGLAEFDAWLDTHGALSLAPITGMHQPGYFLVDLALEPDWQALRGEMPSFPGIEYIQPNYLSSFHIEPNDPLYPEQFHTVVANPQAWNYSTGSSQVVVGIIDSGCLINHPDLSANIYINAGEDPALGLHDNGIDDDGNGYIDDWCGWDFSDAPELSDTAVGDYLDQDNDVEDENFHGTHVSGIVGAVGNNGIGVSGVCWNVKIMPIRAGFRTTAGQGYLQDDDAAAAIIYAADNGCHVLNLSWGDPNYSPIISDACNYAHFKGVTIVASAGNDPGPVLSYPAKLSNVISVGAINRNRNIAGFSSYGPDLDLVAPGEMVLSTYKTDLGEEYFLQSGTSMSSPYVAGAAALLLSLHPNLSPDEVRARLLTSTDDLGTPGFDLYYGHGLLNTKKLLENTQPPLVYIDQPLDHSGITGSVDITGTVAGSDFFRYSVMYTNAKVPTILDWYDVQTHQNYPSHYLQQVQNGVLAHFHIPEAFAEDQYTVRVQYESTAGKKFNYFRTFIYDRTAPILRDESVMGFSRYDGQNLRYYVSAVFNEFVRTELMLTDSAGTQYSIYGALMDSTHVWAIPPQLPQGPISIQIRASNISNADYLSPVMPDFLDISYEVVPSYGYSWQQVGEPRVPLNFTYDYDADGYKEYIAMDLPKTGYGGVFVYQPQAGGHVLKHSFNDSFWLLGAGNTNDLGQEILMLKGETAVLMESQLTSTYPNLPLWEDTSITGGVIADYSRDGIGDLLLVKILPTKRVIQAYKRSGNTFEAKNQLDNDSETDFYNTFVPTITVKNFDNDNYLDILTADTDGDVMIYEIRNDNLHELAWSHRMPIGNTYSIASGDFDGNGRQDFFIGGYYKDNLDPNQNFWYFEGFRNVSNNNYTSMGSIMFNEVTSQNAVLAHDLDNDGKDELILAIAPNLYTVKYVDGEFKPQFYGQSFRNYALMAYKDANNRSYFLTNYEVEPDSVIFVEWTSEDPFTGPSTPANFQARALDGNTVHLSWIDNGAQFYRLYRRDEDGQTVVLDDVTADFYMDLQVEAGATYTYAVTACDPAYAPMESVPTVWQDVVPYDAPQVSSVTMTGSNTLLISFDQPMSGQILNPNLYHVSHGMGRPSSVNSTAAHYGAQLFFNRQFPAIDESFTLTLSNIISAQNIPLDQVEYTFNWQQDTVAPGVVEALVLADQQTVRISLSEAIAAQNPNPELIDHYILHNHSNDPDNAIVRVVHEENAVLIHLAHKVRYGSSAYTITVHNLRDLSGNLISPQNNVARFYLVNNHDLKHLVVYPNPVRADSKQCSLINFPSGKTGNLRIYDSAGSLVRTAAIGPFDPVVNNVDWSWDLKNNNGLKVASGVYFYVVEMDGKTARGKIAIIN